MKQTFFLVHKMIRDTYKIMIDGLCGKRYFIVFAVDEVITNTNKTVKTTLIGQVDVGP